MKKFRRASLCLMALFLTLSLALAGCGGGKSANQGNAGSDSAQSGSDSSQSSGPQVAIYAYEDEPVVNWDPADGASNEVVVLNNLYETLLRYDPETNSFEKVLATDYQASEDGKTWTFKLREGVKFHTGREMTAEAVKFSVERCIQRGKGVCYIWGPVERIDTPDKYTVVFHLKYPAAMDMVVASSYGAHIVDPEAVREHGEDWLSQGNEAGTGPYRLKSWQKGGDYVLEKFPEYWGGWEGKHFDVVVIKGVPDATTRRQMMEGGKADITSRLDNEQIDAIKQNPNLVVTVGPSWQSVHAPMNTQKAPLNNKLVRQAIAYATPYDDIIQTAVNGYATQSIGVIPPGLWGHLPDLPHYTYDPEKAKQLLAQAGYPNGGLKLTVTFGGDRGYVRRAVELWKSALEKVGIELELRGMNWEQQWDLARSENAADRQDITVFTWWPAYPDPFDTFINRHHSEEKPFFNLSYYKNPQVDALIEEAQALTGTDKEAALAKYRQVQEILYDEVPEVLFFDLQSVRVMQKSFKGYKDNPAYTGVVFFYNCYREG